MVNFGPVKEWDVPAATTDELVRRINVIRRWSTTDSVCMMAIGHELDDYNKFAAMSGIGTYSTKTMRAEVKG